MDLGFFKRNPYTMWLWIVLPLALILSLYYASNRFATNTQQALDRRHAFLNLIPELDQHLGAADELLSRFSSGPEEGVGGLDILSSAVQECAQNAQFTINDVSFEEPLQDQKDEALQHIVLVLRGEGTLHSIMTFCNDVRQDKRLMNLTTANLKSVASSPQPFYHAEFRLTHYKVQL